MLKLKLLIKNLIMKFLSKIFVRVLFRIYRGDNFYFMLWELDQHIEEQIKHNIDKLSSEQIAAFLLARNRLYELVENYGIGFNHVE